MNMYKLLTEADICIDVDAYDGEVWSDTTFSVVRIDGSTIEGITLDIKEAKRVVKELNSFVARVDKRTVTAKSRSAAIVKKQKAAGNL